VSLSQDSNGNFYLQELAKELKEKPLLALTHVDSLVMEVTEIKKRDDAPGMKFIFKADKEWKNIRVKER